MFKNYWFKQLKRLPIASHTHTYAHSGPYCFLSFYSLFYKLTSCSGPPSHPIALGSHLQSLLLQGHSISAGLVNLASFAPSYTEAKYGICRCLLPAFDFCHHLPSPKPVRKDMMRCANQLKSELKPNIADMKDDFL